MVSCFIRFLRGNALAALLVGLLGCGLGDYEKLMKEERDKAKVVEEDKKHLGEAVDPPVMLEGEAFPPTLQMNNFFLRPPKLFKCKPGPPKLVVPGIGLYLFEGQDGCNVLAAASIQERMNKDFGIFQTRVWEVFREYSGTRVPKNKIPPEDVPALVKKEIKTPPITREPSPPHKFEYFTWDETELAVPKKDPKAPAPDKDAPKKELSRFYFWFHQSGNTYVAVIFQVPLARVEEPALLKGMDVSLRWMGIDEDGQKLRVFYQRWH
jgi:hypothetical protein